MMADRLSSYVVPDPWYPQPLPRVDLMAGENDCMDDNQLERWRYEQPGLSYDGDIGEGPDSWGV